MSLFDKLERSAIDLINKTLGQDVTYNLFDGNPVEVLAVFNHAYIDVVGIVSKRPILRIAKHDLPRVPSIKDTVSFKGVSYKVSEVRDEGRGTTYTVILREIDGP